MRPLVRCLIAALVASCLLCASADALPRARYGAHSMLYLDSPYALKVAMFRDARRIGAGWIRLDVAVPEIVESPTRRNWEALDEYIRLARRYRLRVSAVLLGTPWWLAKCPPGTALADTYRCPPADAGTWAGYAAEIAQHARGTIDTWEILNEPDMRGFFTGGPGDYAAMLAASYDAIKRANPSATILAGGVRGLRSRPWLAEALRASGPHVFDVASVHVRGRADGLASDMGAWRRFFRARGFTGPLWVTEHGYPSQARWQYDRRFRGGSCSQAAYLRFSVPTLLRNGAAKVFVTERDNLTGRYASEGIISSRRRRLCAARRLARLAGSQEAGPKERGRAHASADQASLRPPPP